MEGVRTGKEPNTRSPHQEASIHGFANSLSVHPATLDLSDLKYERPSHLTLFKQYRQL